MATPRSVSFYTLGCKLNYSETSAIGRQFEQAEVVRDRQQVRRLAALVQRDARGVNDSVSLDVEFLIAELFEDHEERGRVEEDGAEDRALGFRLYAYINEQEIVEQTGTSQSNISQHLEQLRNKNIVTSRKEANRIFYRIRNGKLLELIGTMRNVLCPTNLNDLNPPQ